MRSVNVRCFCCFYYILGSQTNVIHSKSPLFISQIITELHSVADTGLDAKDKIMNKIDKVLLP